MEDTDNLKSEIILLKKMMAILFDQIAMLKSENSILKNKMGVKNVIDTNDIFEKGIQNMFSTIENFEKGTENSMNTFDKNENGVNNSIDANDNLKKGIINSSNTNDNIEKGIKNVLDTNVKLDNTVKRDPDWIPGIAPRPLRINNDSARRLGFSIREVFHYKTKWMKAFRVSQELLLIHNNGFASSDEMRKICGLSKPGFAKHLPTLKRKGLIYRASHKKYMLTELAISHLNKVFGDGDRSLY